MYYSDFRPFQWFDWFHVDVSISLNRFHVDGERFGNDTAYRLDLSPCGRHLSVLRVLDPDSEPLVAPGE